jgi:acetyltransferase-like isoleucine patch superfamily enzyme
MLKTVLSWLLWPLARLTRTLGTKLLALWSFARLREGLATPLHASNVILGPVAVEGTGNIRIGRNARIYPGVLLETQGAGRIVIGDNVVLSRGVHIVAFDAVTLGDHCMLGEYASLRDADHKKSQTSMRDSGYDCAAIRLGRNVWVGRAACVLKGVHIGANSIVGAQAVVTRDVAAASLAVGVPARAQPLSAPPLSFSA